MLTVTLNGKDISNDDLNILITQDIIKDELEVQMFNGEETCFNKDSNDIEISIDIKSDTSDIFTFYKRGKHIDDSINIIRRAINVINAELINIDNEWRELLEKHNSLCDSIIKRDDKDIALLRKIKMLDPILFKDINEKKNSIHSGVEKLIKRYAQIDN